MRATSSVLPVASSPLVETLVKGRRRSATVLAAFPTALYLLAGAHEHVVPVLTAEALRLPTGVCLTQSSTEVEWGVRAGDQVSLGSGRVDLPYAALRVVRTWRPSRVRSSSTTPSWPRAATLAATTVGSSALGSPPFGSPPFGSPPFGPASLGFAPEAPGLLSLAAGVSGFGGLPARGMLRGRCAEVAGAALAGGPVHELVAGLIGAGQGLTPSGDDALCGVLLTLRAFAGSGSPPAAPSASGHGTPPTGLNAVAEAVRDLTTRTTSLSASLLLAAAQGYAVHQVVCLIDLLASARLSASDPALQQAMAEVLAIGHSSGHDLLAGIAGTLDALHNQDARRPLALEGARHG